MEIAGIVLGAFPLLLDGAQSLSGVFQDVKYWLHFEAEFERFMMNIENQQIAYSQMLDLLLDPLEAIPPHDRETLKESPSCSLWQDAHIHAALKNRLQPKCYGWFIGHLKKMKVALQSLYQLLPIGKAYFIDSSDVKSLLFRFQNSFSHDKDQLPADIKDANKELRRFLKMSVTIQNARIWKPSKATSGSNFKTPITEFQEHARLVLKGLRQNWACSLSCTGRHSCSISMQGEHIKAFLSSGGKRKHIRFELKDTRETRRLTDPPSDSSSAKKHQDVTVLSRQIAKKREMQRQKTEAPSNIVSLVAPTLSAASRPFNPDADIDPDGLERATEKLRKRPNQVIFGHQDLPLWAAPVLGISQPPSHHDGKLAIDSMCRTIAKESIESCLGFLELPDTKLYLHLEPHSQVPPFEQIPLHYFIGDTPERDFRLSLGCAVTKTVLYLGSAWIPDSWQESSLLLLRTPDICPQPYISLPTVPTATQSTSPEAASSKAKSSLLRLGIILLELLFRETLESQSFRNEYLDDSGKPNDMTDLCTAMIWHKKVEREFVEGDLDLTLSRAIDRCIRCSFDPWPLDLDNSEFVQAVWTSVVQPLEEYIRGYQRWAS